MMDTFFQALLSQGFCLLLFYIFTLLSVPSTVSDWNICWVEYFLIIRHAFNSIFSILFLVIPAAFGLEFSFPSFVLLTLSCVCFLIGVLVFCVHSKLPYIQLLKTIHICLEVRSWTWVLLDQSQGVGSAAFFPGCSKGEFFSSFQSPLTFLDLGPPSPIVREQCHQSAVKDSSEYIGPI